MKRIGERIACWLNRKAIEQYLFELAEAKYPDRHVTEYRRYVHSVWSNTSNLKYRPDMLPMTRWAALHLYSLNR
ncbi:hypothetical protein [Vibrio agarivorans]|uniref:hypothetical protein n=1 Tax=Vibrio agarivorans TaxID=153622 RepID=UPI002231A66E|nr:hypothetical protein [Vibrio agarivorans]MDN3659963.1 hypothetical protein [Vibrio agarivorans]